ncbi:ER protein folding protein [Schizosaccharomyces japonicus yFS275]|uniref:ER protein folding protein n=1 Tax=Schizosaccharomyces japonicus (strain yFS275 / FY16936) TaxID=402676 RepID=B6JWW8_SCHJY|nr:ER protein folding protein [Schizosaccharomyces japonicus yFS275]EEB05869.1 ER protein folding protein [Schizosaccharomyces japonicus yFS275]
MTESLAIMPNDRVKQDLTGTEDTVLDVYKTPSKCSEESKEFRPSSSSISTLRSRHVSKERSHSVDLRCSAQSSAKNSPAKAEQPLKSAVYTRMKVAGEGKSSINMDPLLNAKFLHPSTANNARPSATPGTPKPESSRRKRRLRSFWDYLKLELTEPDMVQTSSLKKIRVANFLKVPLAIEKTFLFGWLVCVDCFLYIFVLFPFRLVMTFFMLFLNFLSMLWSFIRIRPRNHKFHLSLCQKTDILKFLLVCLTARLLHNFDASRVYHVIRAQAAIRFYVLYNLLEVVDRLCSAFGQDLLDCLFSLDTLQFPFTSASGWLHLIWYFGLCVAYMVLHSLVLLYQILTLNVTINSYSNNVFGLLISNQFVEIKGAVFKKFEKENLFQITCSDIIERFQITVMVIVVFLRNVTELYATSSPTVPLFTYTKLKKLVMPFLWVIGSEYFVDWLKHAFVTKFNYIRPSIYARFTDVLCHDYIKVEQDSVSTSTGRSQFVARRMGLPVLPLAVVFIHTLGQTWSMFQSARELHRDLDRSAAGFLPDQFAMSRQDIIGGIKDFASESFWEHTILSAFSWAIVVGIVVVVVVSVKVTIGMSIYGFAQSRVDGIHQRERESNAWEKERKANNWFRGHIEIDKPTKSYLNDPADDLATDKNKSFWSLERYSMVSKRIW